jgi:hypothetical protein
MVAIAPRCWICGAPADSREHKPKKSDLKGVFGSVSQKAPLRMHTLDRSNRPIGSFDASALKWEKSLCHACNTTLTKPHDKAWEAVSDWLRTRTPPIAAGMVVRATEALPNNTRALLVNMHLFWVKAMGCYLIANDSAFDLSTLAKAIRGGKAEADLYLEFGLGRLLGDQLQVAAQGIFNKGADGSVNEALVSWTIGTLAVRVFYLRGSSAKRNGGRWHPRMNTSRFVIGDFRGEAQQG